MPTRVRLETRRRSDPAVLRGGLQETVVLRGQEFVAVLRQGDPLRYALELSAKELRSIRKSLAPILEKRPQVKELLEALIEYKEGQTSEREYLSRGACKKC